tara:strand:+ start:1417 stop:1635 length:219 start_codon:yes stop_codon:yes gene_type:complete
VLGRHAATKESVMNIIVESIMSGKPRAKYIDVTQRQIDAWQSGVLIQEAMPNVSDQDRDFIKGIFWDELGWS